MADNTNNVESATWEVVSVTDSIHAAGPGPQETGSHGPGPHGPDLLEESREKAAPPSDLMFMSGHFSLSKNTELEALLMETNSKTLIERELPETLIEPELPKTLSEPELPKTLIEPELPKTLSWMEPKLYSPSAFSSNIHENNNNSNNDNEERESGEERESIVRSEEEGESEWWEKVGCFYRRVKGEKMFVVFAAATALVGVAILSRRLQRDRIELERLKLRFSFTNQSMNSMVAGPLSKIKDIFPTNNVHLPMNQASYADFAS